MSTLNCLIVDDEPLAREGLANYVKAVDFLSLAGAGENALAIPTLLERNAVDLLFLDIQMPFISGIDFLKATPNPPMVILTTAFPNYAIEGYQLNVMDYLLKPITFERFFQAVTKAKEFHALRSTIVNPEVPVHTSYFFIRCGNVYEKIMVDDILYVEGLQNYVKISTSKGKYITLLSLKQLEENLSGRPFIRVHKSFIVAVARIERIENNEIIIEKTKIPIGKSYRDSLMEVVEKGLWEKK